MGTLKKLGTVFGLAAGAYSLFIRPRMLRWGATEEEVRGPFPGADLIPGGKRFSTMAVTIEAPPSRVWPWLAQMGCDRAGWYSWDFLDNGGRPSARRIHPEWQSLSVGQHLALVPDGSLWFEIAALEPERFLGLRTTFTPMGRPLVPSAPRPRAFTDSLWAFQLKELPGGRTRLIVSGYSITQPRWMEALGNFLLWDPAHWIMQTRQFTNLKRRAEGTLREEEPTMRGASPRGERLANAGTAARVPQ